MHHRGHEHVQHVDEEAFIGSEPRHGLTLSFSSANDVLEALEKPVHDLSFRSDERMLLRHGHTRFTLSEKPPSEILHLFLYNDYLMICSEIPTPPESSGCFPFLSKPRSPPKRRPRSLRVALIACLFHSYVSAQADVSGLRGAGVVDVKLRKRTLSLFFDSAGEAEEWEKHLSATIRNAQSLPAGLYERSYRKKLEKDKRKILTIVFAVVIPLSLLGQCILLIAPAKMLQTHIFKECFIPETMREQLMWILERSALLLERQGVAWWVDDGLMLGIAREGGMIPWDGDVDISIMQEDAWKLTVGLEKVEDNVWVDFDTQLKLVYFGYESIFEWELLHIDQNHHRAHGSEWRDQIYTSGPFNDPTQWDRRVELYEFHPVVNDNDSYVDEDMITSQYAKTKKEWIGSRPFRRIEPGGFEVRVPEKIWNVVHDRYTNANKLRWPRRCDELPTTHVPGLTKQPVHHYPENYTLYYLALMVITPTDIVLSILGVMLCLGVAYTATSCAFEASEGEKEKGT